MTTPSVLEVHLRDHQIHWEFQEEEGGRQANHLLEDHLGNPWVDRHQLHRHLHCLYLHQSPRLRQLLLFLPHQQRGRSPMSKNQRISLRQNSGIVSDDRPSSTLNRRGFNDDPEVICFLLSFMMEGLPEKFAANYLDDILDNLRRRRERAQAMCQPLPAEPNWGSVADFEAQCQSIFGDQNKKPNAENQLTLMQQGAKTAEEYFQEFDQLVRTAGYQQNHNNVLIKYLHEQVKWSIIDKIYSSGHLPGTYQEWQAAMD
jgi:Retrotransposon gag protein